MSQDVVVRFVSGERAAFGEVFDALRGAVFREVQRYFRSPFDQEEAFQEVWLHLYRQAGRFDANRHAELGGWVRRVARNRCLDLLKAARRRPEVPLGGLEPWRPAPQPGATSRGGIRQALDDVVGQLDAEARQHFRLCFVDELPHEEIASALGVTVRRSKYLKKKALARLIKNPALRRLHGP